MALSDNDGFQCPRCPGLLTIWKIDWERLGVTSEPRIVNCGGILMHGRAEIWKIRHMDRSCMILFDYIHEFTPFTPYSPPSRAIIV